MAKILPLDNYRTLSTSLGSTSFMSYGAGHASGTEGTLVPGTLSRHLPFGDWRTQPSADLTDLGFTGHKSNNVGSNDIGLIYMNARYYVPTLNRFLSADVIVPDPTNPQQYNRYTYSLNNPLRYTDPTGHCVVEDIDSMECTFTPPTSSPSLPPGVEIGTFSASTYLQELLSLLGITQTEYDILVHSYNDPNFYYDTDGDGKTDLTVPNTDLFRHEIGAWVLAQEHHSFHPLNYLLYPSNLEYFSIRGLYTASVLLQVIYNDETINGRDVFAWIQSDNNNGRFAYPGGRVGTPEIYNDFLIIANLSENGAFPDFLASYPGSGSPYYYGHWALIEGMGDWNGLDSLSVSSWAWNEVDWVPSLSNFYSVTGYFNSCRPGQPC